MKKILNIVIIFFMLLSCTALHGNSIEYVERKTKEIKIEKVNSEKWLNFLYNNPFGRATTNLIVKRKFLTEYYGKYMNTTNSAKKISKFIEKYDINMEESEKKADEFKTFNEFFYRKLKKDARPIDNNKYSVVSPADGKILVFSKISDIDGLYVKGVKFNLSEFLKDKKLVSEYENGSIAIVRLAPTDYHRVHFPYNGKISKTKLINGVYYSVSPISLKKISNVLWENKREISRLETNSSIGDILIIEVGATMVGGIKQTYVPNTYVQKGQEKSYFYFGGSTVILIFKENCIKFDEDLLKNTQKKLETTVRVGEKIASSIIME